jgi:hypothetical protein
MRLVVVVGLSVCGLFAARGAAEGQPPAPRQFQLVCRLLEYDRGIRQLEVLTSPTMALAAGTTGTCFCGQQFVKEVVAGGPIEFVPVGIHLTMTPRDRGDGTVALAAGFERTDLDRTAGLPASRVLVRKKWSSIVARPGELLKLQLRKKGRLLYVLEVTVREVQPGGEERRPLQ